MAAEISLPHQTSPIRLLAGRTPTNESSSKRSSLKKRRRPLGQARNSRSEQYKLTKMMKHETV